MLRSFTGAYCTIAADNQSAFPSVTLSAALPRATFGAEMPAGTAYAAVAQSPAKTTGLSRVEGKAQPDREGTGYAIRARHKGHDIYLSGYATAAAINKEVRERRSQIDK